MNRPTHSSLSDEKLNAFIDDELDFDEKESVYRQIGQDDTLNREAHELRQLRAMLRHAYRHPPVANQATQPGAMRGNGVIKAVAAILLLALGALTGWYGNQQLSSQPSPMLALHDGASLRHTSNTSQQNLLLHINSGDPKKMAAALDYAEELLAKMRRENPDFRLEVVANEGGIKLLRKDTSPFAKRVESLLGKYDNVSFLACAHALQKLRKQGVKVELLPGTRSDHSALEEIVKRLEGGWRYLKV